VAASPLCATGCELSRTDPHGPPPDPQAACDAGPGASGVSQRAVAIACGDLFACALLSDGTVRCWGDNGQGALGVGLCPAQSSVPLKASGLAGVKSISASGLHACAALNDGTVKCWGEIPFGSALAFTPVAVPSLTGVSSVAAGSGVDCALVSSGGIRCWGYRGGGALGDGTGLTVNTGGLPPEALPTPVSSIDGAIAVTAGSFSACALLKDTTVRCWGQNESGELGDGTENASAVPVAVKGLTGAVAITAGASAHAGCPTCYGYTCALLSDGTVRCWGEDLDGELGNGGSVASTTPVQVSNLSGVTSVTVAMGATYAVLSSGAVEAWGVNSFGLLGPDAGADVPQPILLSSLTKTVAACGGVSFACALLADGTVECWGDNGNGQLGDGQTGIASPTPVAVTW
jgi:alpha-tubulin suppressor-like RCC1 family protein